MLHTDVLQEGIQSPIYDASEGFDISSTMNQLLHILRGVSCYRYTAPLIYYQDHLRKLETLRPRLPADPRLPTVQHESHQAPIAVILNVPEEQQFALVSSPSCNIPLTYLDSKALSAYHAHGDHHRSYLASAVASSCREHYQTARLA